MGWVEPNAVRAGLSLTRSIIEGCKIFGCKLPDPLTAMLQASDEWPQVSELVRAMDPDWEEGDETK
jgi:hypothetical protein